MVRPQTIDHRVLEIVADPDRLPGFEEKTTRLGRALRLEGFVVGRPIVSGGVGTTDRPR